MKKFTLIFAILSMTFGFINQSMATKEVKVSQIISPTNGASENVGVPFDIKFCIQNTGDEALSATDDIFITGGQLVGTNFYPFTSLGFPAKLKTPHKALALLDTITIFFKLTFTSGSGTITLFFGATNTTNFQGPTVNITLVGSGIADLSKSINKVWFSGNSIKYQLVPNASCLAKLNITNLNGQVVKSSDLNLVEGALVDETISTGYLPKGIYILSIQSPYGIDTKKFIVQ
jgi:hypothetical protein